MFLCVLLFLFFKQKTAYEMRISDWSSDVCSSDLSASDDAGDAGRESPGQAARTVSRKVSTALCSSTVCWLSWPAASRTCWAAEPASWAPRDTSVMLAETSWVPDAACCTFEAISSVAAPCSSTAEAIAVARSEEHTSELQALMRISYAVFCLKKKKHNINIT